MVDPRFYENQAEFQSPNYQVPPELRDYLDAQGFVVYSSAGNDTMVLTTHPEFDYLAYTSIYDVVDPPAPQWKVALADRYFEVKWSYERVGSYVSPTLHLDFRDTKKDSFFGLGSWYTSTEYLAIYWNGVKIHGSLNRLYRSDIVSSFGAEQNVTLEVKGAYMSANIILLATTNDTTILQGWDTQTLNYIINYEIDFDAMKPDAWGLISQLLFFQTPDFGFPDELNTIIAASFSIAIYIVVAIIIYTIVTRLLPTISGGLEG